MVKPSISSGWLTVGAFFALGTAGICALFGGILDQNPWLFFLVGWWAAPSVRAVYFLMAALLICSLSLSVLALQKRGRDHSIPIFLPILSLLLARAAAIAVFFIGAVSFMIMAVVR
jgi:hypothetical protein